MTRESAIWILVGCGSLARPDAAALLDGAVGLRWTWTRRPGVRP
jgi:hypothetical protein